jgi:hypothetical protein
MCSTAKNEFHNEKLYRLFDLQDLPKKLKQRLSAEKAVQGSKSGEVVPDSSQAGPSKIPEKTESGSSEVPEVTDADAT